MDWVSPPASLSTLTTLRYHSPSGVYFNEMFFVLITFSLNVRSSQPPQI